MYLESLQIHGFKSFGRKTKFNFTDGITSIVGPNGCGKSNIVDAIRWVLGEQKAGIIRSERMDNVIFNGSKSIKPLGMAEVSLTIHNTKNVLPIEFSEVVITRRLFRSLESQYLLNNASCRLKDIQNLFMDTGMGPDAYSIIELSMVENILNGKIDERRRILEEAAGVTKYKLRRRAAFRKLEATEADIVRLNDIISEIEKNVSSLQRQVRKAKRYQEIKEIVKEKEIQFATHNYSKIKSELEPLYEKLHSTQDTRVALTAQYDEKEAEIEQSRLKLLGLERNLHAQQQKLNEISAKIHKKEEQILVDRERRKALQDAKVRLLRDKEEISARIEKNHAETSLSGEKLQQLFHQIQVAENDFQDKNLGLKAMEINVQEKNDQRNAKESQRLQSVESITKQKQEEERINTQLENIDDRIQAINRELEENELLEKIRQDKIERLLLNKADHEADLRQFKMEHVSLQKQIQTLGDQKEFLKERIVNRRGELQTIKERIELLKKFIESYEDHPEGVQHLILQGYLNGGCKGTLAEILTVNSKYRRAIETALGEAAVSLIVEETDQALRCIDVLKADQKGTVTFYPLDKFSSTENGHKSMDDQIFSEKTDGIINWANDLVECSADYRALVNSLLHDYLIVSDLATAKKEASRLRKHHLSLITLNGEIVSTWGPIKGGEDGSSQAGVIGRKALVEELEKKASNLFQKLDDEEKEQQVLASNYQEACSKEQELSKKIKDLESQLTYVEVQLAQLHFESKKESEAQERLEKEKDSLSENRQDLGERIQAISPSLDDMAENRTRFDFEYQLITDELSKLESQLNEHREVVQDSHLNLVGLKGEEKHLQEDISRQQEFEQELKRTLLRTDEEIQSATNEHIELEKRIEANKKSIQLDFDQHKQMEADVNVIEEQYLEGKEKLDEKEKFVKDIRNKKDEVSEDLHRLEMRVSELKMQSANIFEKIKEEYNFQIKKQCLDETIDTETLTEEIAKFKNRLTAMEPVNLLALKEYEKEKARFDFLSTQKNDLMEAEANLNETIRVINKTAREQFLRIFEQIQKNFVKVFSGFFENGMANLKLDPNVDPLESEIIIEADPKGRRISALTLLSGGEKTLTAISLLFAIYLVKPSPFCILDEVDAPLDDANIGRFLKAIRNFSDNTQFMIVTHNKLTMRAADCLYGVTMQEEGVSKVVSVNFTDMDIDKETPKAA